MAGLPRAASGGEDVVKKYSKFIVAVLGAAVTAALQLGLTGTWQQVLTVVSAAITAAAVYQVSNTPTPK